MSPDPDDGEDERAREGDPDARALRRMATEPRTLGLVGAIFLLIIGLPAALFALRGQWQAVLVLVGLFVLMVVATGYAFKEAVEAQRVMLDDASTPGTAPGDGEPGARDEVAASDASPHEGTDGDR